VLGFQAGRTFDLLAFRSSSSLNSRRRAATWQARRVRAAAHGNFERLIYRLRRAMSISTQLLFFFGSTLGVDVNAVRVWSRRAGLHLPPIGPILLLFITVSNSTLISLF
jgi:hypothetical protein